MQAVEQRLAIQPQLEPALVIVIMLFVSIGNGVYIQEHLNRIWDRTAVPRRPHFRPTHRSHPPCPVPQRASHRRVHATRTSRSSSNDPRTIASCGAAASLSLLKYTNTSSAGNDAIRSAQTRSLARRYPGPVLVP